MYRWLQSFIQHKASNIDQDKQDDFGIKIPLEVVLKIDRVNISPFKYEQEEQKEDNNDQVTIPEICRKCYHLDDVNNICKANMSFEEVSANEDCPLFYDKDRVNSMGFSASLSDEDKITHTNSIDFEEIQQKIIDEITQISAGKYCIHRDKNRSFLKSPLKSFKYSNQSCIEHFLTCERDYLKKKTKIKKGEKEQAALFEAAKKLCSFIRRRRFGSEETGNGFIIKKAEVNKYDGTVEATDAVDLFMASVMKTFHKLPKDLLVKWSEWCNHYRIDTNIEEGGKKDLKKRVRNSINKSDENITHTATTAWKIGKDKYKMNEDEIQRRINEIHKYERVVKRSLSQTEADRMFKRLFDGKIWEDVKAPINFKLL